MQRRAEYRDVVAEVIDELRGRVDAALAAGIKPEHVVVDPGLGFAKTGEHNWALLSRFEEVLALEHPVLVAASRKRFLGVLLAESDGTPREPLRRDDATTAVTALAAAAGAWCVRVHDVAPNADAVRVVSRWARETHA